MSLILESVKATIPKEYYDLPLKKVATFAFITTVKSKRLGTSMTLSDERVFEYKIHLSVSHMGEVETLGLEKLLSWTDSLQGIERSFAIAAINSALPLDGKKYFTGNALELAARLGAGKRVAVVGHFPHTDKIREVASAFHIIEKRPQEGDLHAGEAIKIIPQADVVAMTGVTCLNDTMEGLLALKKPGAKIIVVGPSVPMSSALFDFGVDVIGGAWIEDEDEVYAKASQGGAPRHLNGMRSVLYPKDPELLAGYEEVFPPL
ncbi:MAG: DUF364 domain-containing protein [Salinivirgaceae bacterium]|nr:DUF364 domain-containing protein [Salinivirgaceae bacterium]